MGDKSVRKSNSKTAASKTLKEKRQAKAEKKRSETRKNASADPTARATGH